MTMRNFALDRPTRRGWLQAAAGGMAGAGLAGWFGSLASAMSDPGRPKRSCILLWMNGGPSQTDTFDLKPGHEHGGPFRPIASRVPGIEVCEHLPGIAQWTDQLAIIRSMSTKEGDHGRARDNLRTGYFPQASIQFPVLGSLVSKEFVGQAGDLPNYVSIFPRGLFKITTATRTASGLRSRTSRFRSRYRSSRHSRGSNYCNGWNANSSTIGPERQPKVIARLMQKPLA